MSAMPRGEIDPGLGRVRAALERLGSPQQSLAGRVLHVAGTNGKGSVCAMLFSALRQARLRVAMFTSPHLVEPFDSFRLAEDGQDKDFSKEQLTSLQLEIAQTCGLTDGEAARTLTLTTFELQVVMALTLFARQKVDMAIIEVGMGGRDDATNVLIQPAVCAISSIAMDHEKFLGSTREEIASHKAGIFQLDRPAVVAASGMSESVKKVITDCAKAVGSRPITWVEPAEVVSPGASQQGEIAEVQRLRVEGFSEELQLPLLGDYQRSNAALALAMLLELRRQHLALRTSGSQQVLDESVLDDGTIASGMAATKWAGRLEWLQLGTDRVLLDGAHNPHAAEALGGYVDKAVRPRGQPVSWVIALSAGKDAIAILHELLHSDEDAVYTVGFSEVEGMPWVQAQAPDDILASVWSLRPHLRHAQACPDLQSALEVAQADAVASQIVICGSLYLVADCVRLQRSKMHGLQQAKI
ncbi:FOL3 [Symbiodinium natans]|uniref:FOL3 protein n=1 Tax=Symbiodinium natans TaxID=878477 RepID=A0A812NNC9_9DINO|nr:FOL3 [Symbiodinium natans]